MDDERGTIHIRHTRRAADRDTPPLAPPKTAGSVRTLAAPPAVLAALAERRALQTAEAEAAGVWWANSLGLVFTNSIGGATDPARVRAEFARLAAVAGLGDGWTPNHLRHTAASLMADAGLPMAAVADQLGHTTTRMLDAVYRHRVQAVQSAGVTLAGLVAVGHAEARPAGEAATASKPASSTG